MTGPIYGNGRRDHAEPEVVKALEAGGAHVAKLSGNGLPDLLVSFKGVLRLVEVKTGRGKLRTSQNRFVSAWSDSPIFVIRTAAQANKWLRMWEAEANETRIVFPGAASAWGEEWEKSDD